MPDLTALDNATGFALFAFTVFTVAVGVWRKWIVPGWIYQQEVDRRQLAEAQLAATVPVIAQLTLALRGDLPRRDPRPRG